MKRFLSWRGASHSLHSLNLLESSQMSEVLYVEVPAEEGSLALPQPSGVQPDERGSLCRGSCRGEEPRIPCTPST
jgi:hypothetical protein